MRSIRLLIVDDHTLFRRGLVSLLQGERDLEVVGEAASGEEALRLARELQPDIILMDIRMPGMNGVEASERLGQEAPGARILVLTVSEEDEDVFAAIRVGARGYLLKNAEADDLITAIRRVHGGEAVLSPAITLRVFQVLQGTAPFPPLATLTPREREVLRLLAQGADNRQIAEALVVSENTVKTHIHNILEKLGLQSRSQLAAYARRITPGL